MTTLYLNVISGGILIGVVYALIALGLTIIFGVMRVVNFAHGEMVVIGMYVGYGVWSATKLPPLMLAPVAAVLLFALGYVLQRAIVNAFIDRPQHAQFILFISFALIITGLHLALFGPDPRPIQTIESMQSYTIGPVRLDVVRSQAALMALLLIAALMLFLKYSTLGRSIRAAADNHSYTLAVTAMLCAVVSAFLYLRIVVSMFMTDSVAGDDAREKVAVPFSAALGVGAALAFTIVAGVLPGWLLDLARHALPLALGR